MALLDKPDSKSPIPPNRQLKSGLSNKAHQRHYLIGETMIKKNTYMRAYEACERFFVETGQMPTIDAIKPIIRVNSPSTISSAIKDWKNALSQTVRKDQGVDSGVPTVLQDMVNILWEQALTEAKTSLKERTEALQGKQAALAEKEKALNDETVRVQQLVSLTEQKFQEEIGFLKSEIARLAADSKALKEEAGKLRATTTGVEKKNAVLEEEIRQEKDKYNRLESQYDKEHGWALKRIEEEKESYRKQIQNEMTRLQSETARSKQSEEIVQAKVEMMVKQSIEDKNRIMSLERELSDEKLKLAELTLNEAKLQGELNDKNDRIRSLVNKTKKK